MEIKDRLLSMQDKEYKKFHSSLMPGIDEDRIIGIRIPQLRKFAKSISKENAEIFMKALPHYYYEENNVHAFLIENISDFCECVNAVNTFLPFVDNWATCDSLRPGCFRKHKDQLLEQIRLWLNSKHTYTVRFGLEMLMCHYLDDGFNPLYLELAASVESDEYYVNMMQAWFFATALAKQYESAVTFIEEYRLSEWVHNKTIQKSVESFRISKERKDYLKKFRL